LFSFLPIRRLIVRWVAVSPPACFSSVGWYSRIGFLGGGFLKFQRGLGVFLFGVGPAGHFPCWLQNSPFLLVLQAPVWIPQGGGARSLFTILVDEKKPLWLNSGRSAFFTGQDPKTKTRKGLPLAGGFFFWGGGKNFFFLFFFLFFPKNPKNPLFIFFFFFWKRAALVALAGGGRSFEFRTAKNFLST